MRDRFKNLISSAKPVVVDFYTSWCGPCKDMVPVLQMVKDKMKNNVRIVKVDVDKNPFIATRYNVRTVPTITIFKDGEPVWSVAGVTGAEELIEVLENVAELK
jgi:thioredoxin 1